MRIEVGYGLEGALPDALAGQIIQLAVAPVFRKEQYEQGISAGVKAIMQAVQGEFEAQTPAADAYENAPLTQAELEAQRKSIEAAAKLVFFLGAILLTVDLLRYGNYVRSHSRSSSRYSFAEWFLRFAFLLAVISFLFRILIYSMLFSRGGYSSGGRGGFSGGGGGSFGGGGASGRW